MGRVITKVGGRTTISAKVFRADGTVEDLGVIATTKPVSIFGKIVNIFKKILK